MTARPSNNIPRSLRELWQFQDHFGRGAVRDTMAEHARAIVSHDTYSNGGWKLQDINVREPGEGELLVEMVASGVCHTDALIGGIEGGAVPIAFYPRVLGHEGSGYVKSVGPNVTVAAPGDPVLLSFSFCNSCAVCKAGHYSHCNTFNPINFADSTPVFSLKSSDKKEADIAGGFFGQSSFASLSIVKQTSVVNAKDLVKNKHELQLFSPLGCGIQTGAGTVINAAKASVDDIVCILGLGGVGLSAIMAAKIQGSHKIIGVDRVASRLELARELGATDVVNTSDLPEGKTLVEVLQELGDGIGPSITIDTSGVPKLIEGALEASRNKGQVIQVGSAPFDFKLEIVPFMYMVRGVQYYGVIEGAAYPPDFVPRMIKWYREGKFPLDKMMKFLPAEQFDQALHEMHSGETIKPILTWS